MEQIRIDRRTLRLRARHRQEREALHAESLAPLRYAAPSPGSDPDDDLLTRIDALLGELHEDEDES